jgi:phosphate starvation-inducible PhoH-like protein
MNRPLGSRVRPAATPVTIEREFADNRLALLLFGPHHAHLAQMELALEVALHARGNRLAIVGDAAAAERAAAILDRLYRRLEEGHGLEPQEIDAMVRMTADGQDIGAGDVGVTIRHRSVVARTPTQAEYLRAIDRHDLVIGLGPAGTGKTYLAVAKAVERLVNGHVDRIILSRPAVEAGEQLGFLPGNMREKVDPYLRPLYDALYDMLPAPQVVKRLESGEIEVAPLAFMRGRTLANAFVILDEAQNTTAVQMKMFLTRLGENARMVVTGDLSQVDLPKGTRSGLRQAVEILEGVDGIAFTHFTEADVVRHPLVTRIVRAYDEAEERLHVGAQYEDADAATERRPRRG